MSKRPANESHLGVRIIKPLELLDWKMLRIDGAVPLESFSECPAHAGTRAEAVAALADESGAQIVRVGCCPRCGYVGYIDRPADVWIKRFYLSGMWDGGEGAKKTRRTSAMRIGAGEYPLNDSVGLIARLRLDPSRSVCEIGCGYGESLAYLRRRGFQRIVGTEASPHRARAASETLQTTVHSGSFEDLDMNLFRGQAPFGLMFAHHVLEHVADPRAVLSRCAALQEEGDYLVLSVPDVSAEPSMAVLAYFPHLHAFTFEAVARLLELHGYEVAARSADQRVITVAARRVVAEAVSRTQPRPFVKEIETKLVRGLGLGNAYRATQRRLWWAKKGDYGAQAPYAPQSMYADLCYRIGTGLGRLRAPEMFARGVQSLLVEDLPRGAAGPEAPRIHIRFAGPLTLFYK